MFISFEGTAEEVKQEMRLFLGVNEKTASSAVLRAAGVAVTKDTPKAAEEAPQEAEEPKKKASKAKKKAKEPNGADNEAEVIDRTMVREKCSALIDTEGKDALQEILSDIGCRTFGDVKEEQLVPLLKAVEARL